MTVPWLGHILTLPIHLYLYNHISVILRFQYFSILGVSPEDFDLLPVMYLLGFFLKRSSTKIRAPQSFLCLIHLKMRGKKGIYVIRGHPAKICGNQEKGIALSQLNMQNYTGMLFYCMHQKLLWMSWKLHFPSAECT